MSTKLTVSEILERFKTEVSPHRAESRVWDYGEKLEVMVWRSEDGSHLFTMPDLPVHELREEHYLSDVISGLRREIDEKIKRPIQPVTEEPRG